MYSSYLCACGCGDNVFKGGEYVPGHERPRVANAYKKQKHKELEAVRARRAARVHRPPTFTRGEGQPVGKETLIPKGLAPHFGRKQ